MDLQNKGVISLHDGHTRQAPPDARTLIVSGVARSGTSMVARVLQGAGVFMGDQLDDVVFEDHDFSVLFSDPNYSRPMIDTLLRRRDEQHLVWGFKRPHLHMQGSHTIDLFRNPSVILTVRDPVAIAERNAIAEQRNPADVLGEAMDDLQGMLRYAESLTCPVLLISYEKAVGQPDQFVNRLLEFCGLDVPAELRAPLLALVEPGRPEYLKTARRVFDGYIDGIDGSTLFGWAWQRGLHLPLSLTVFRDDVVVGTVHAEDHRPDLQQSGIGIGNHGFSFDLGGLGFTATSRISVRIEGRLFALNNSGQTIIELGGDLKRIGIRPADPREPVVQPPSVAVPVARRKRKVSLLP